MKANELRVGNYIEFSARGQKDNWATNPNLDQPFMITMVGYHSCHLIGTKVEDILTAIPLLNTDRSEEDQLILPIPLTEDWLLRFGFEKKENYGASGSWYWSFNYFMIDIGDDGKLVPGSSSHDYDCLTITCAAEVKYVHQLQNLYFALTGEELTLKA